METKKKKQHKMKCQKKKPVGVFKRTENKQKKGEQRIYTALIENTAP